MGSLYHALGPRVKKGGSKWRVIGLHYHVAHKAAGPRRLKVRHWIADVQSWVRVKGNRRYLKNFIPQTGCMKGVLWGHEKVKFTDWTPNSVSGLESVEFIQVTFQQCSGIFVMTMCKKSTANKTLVVYCYYITMQSNTHFSWEKGVTSSTNCEITVVALRKLQKT